MNFLENNCSLALLNEPDSVASFSCGDQDLDDFFTRDCFAYEEQMLGKTYCYRLNEAPHPIVCAFTLANAGVRVSDIPNARRKKIELNIPHAKALKDYPAVLIARLGVAKEYHKHGVGSEALQFIKWWFVEKTNKAGCRFIIVDAYNEASTLAFYQSNGFLPVFSTDQQEKEYRHIEADVPLNTRLLFFDLMRQTAHSNV
jgi:GNAT superfamily N-acetyltransferase